MTDLVERLLDPNAAYSKQTDGDPDPSRYIRWLLAECAEAATEIAALRERVKELEADLRTVQNAAKTIASCHDTELEHLRQNKTFDHKLRSEHESLQARDAMMTEALEAAEARAETAERNLLDLTSLRDMLILCGELGGMQSGEKVPNFLRRIIDGLIDAERKLAEAREALKPLARLEVPKRPQGNAGAYSIYHNDIRAARAITGKD